MKVMTVGWGRGACGGQVTPLSIPGTAEVHLSHVPQERGQKAMSASKKEGGGEALITQAPVRGSGVPGPA